jgi:diaminopimelate epimerase
MRFAKGHGTGNDFLILADPDDALALSAELVARLCDRRFGLGADGVLRAVRADAGGWFMDYRNADGSIAEMCGNGIRVFARYLLGHGLAEGLSLEVQTRAGARQVWAEADGAITVDMGAPEVLGRSVALLGGVECGGLEVRIGNPHLACLVDAPVAGFDLSAPPVVDQARFPAGVNVEVVRVVGPMELEMRVYERGSGATLSCGTGAVAAAVAAAARAAAGPDRPDGPDVVAGSAGPDRPDVVAGSASPDSPDPIDSRAGPYGLAGAWTVDVPGGRLVVTLGATSLLTGPAVIVAEGELSEAWLAGRAVAASSAIG